MPATVMAILMEYDTEVSVYCVGVEVYEWDHHVASSYKACLAGSVYFNTIEPHHHGDLMLSSAWDMLAIFVNLEFFLSSVSIAFFHSGIDIAFQKSSGLGLGLEGLCCDVQAKEV